VFGVKLMWEQFIRLTQDLSGEQNLNTCAMAAIMAAPFSTCKYVFLTRGDRVRQAISYYRALKTGRWNRTEATVAAAGETYDPTAIGALATEIDRLNAQWRQFFSETGVEHLELIYESFIASPETHLRQVFDFVGVTAPASRKWPASSGLLPQSDSTTEEWVARYRSEQQC
jgi:LPS sulfotransferase NodH